MPITTYALSHKDTGSILSYCMLEKQTLPDAAAVSALLDRLVGDKLILSFRTPAGTGFEFAKSDLAVDEITVNSSTQSDFPTNPFAYVLVLPSATAAPGDGTTKTIKLGGVVTLTLPTTGMLEVDLPAALGPPTMLIGILEGRAAQTITLYANASTGTIPLGPVLAGHRAVVFIGQGLATHVGLLTVA